MSVSKNSSDYKSTLNLPQTAFPMKADLVRKEPEILKKWGATGLYEAILKKNEGRSPYILHDGPPYANGHIHFGHILNKILKDIIVKFKNMTGFRSPFIPGWDCHGLPIEHQVDRELGPKKKKMDRLQIRKACREYAQKFVQIQKEEFRRLGVLGDWEKPYLTMSPGYEATIAREFGRFVAKGSIYKGSRPVLWCPHCQTALAEAEVEYEEHESPSIYVRFPITSDLTPLLPKLAGKKVSAVIWTTTPWTLAANLAVALHENYDYVAIPYREEFFVVAKHLLAPFSKLLGSEEPTPVDRFSGRRLENLLCQHPFLPRTSRIVLSDHVTIDAGTGCVHIAPGHGDEDYQVGLKYGLETLTPVDGEGRFTEEAGIPEWQGLKVSEANPQVLEKLKEKGALLHAETIRHMYPHCWRCKNPVIFRATEQWFLSLTQNALRAKALDAIRRAQWIPAWGRERIYGMVERRPDWCLSRQRSWGVPIVAFRCRQCHRLLLDPEVIERIADRFEKEGSDIWFAETPEGLLPKGLTCSGCGKNEWHKEEDILDVWFDSGVSFAAVLEKEGPLRFPADLYLEGSDQHRGWFHSSLLAAVGTRGQAPYRTVLTHGFVVDSEGKKYSKSVGNYIPPEKVLKEQGAEILRLWVAAEDYRNDIRISPEILTRLVEAYRKIRNTCRFLLGNLYDFDPNELPWSAIGTGGPRETFGVRRRRRQKFSEGTGPVPMDSQSELNRWALHHLQKLILRLRKAYEEFDFHIIFHELNRYCTVDLSSFYLDVLKDRLYTSAPNDPARRGAQKVLFEIVTALARFMAPIFSFTAEEVWQQVPSFAGKSPSVHLADLPQADEGLMDETLAARWERFLDLRNEILKALEKARQGKEIGASLEAKILLTAEEEEKGFLSSFGVSLPSLLQVSQVEWQKGEGRFSIEVKRADGQKCARCWTWSTTVGRFPDHPTLCQRCHEVITHL